jgi:hypothetical protein
MPGMTRCLKSGVVNGAGLMRLALNEDNRPITVERALALINAVCSGASVFPILYVVQQPAVTGW